jgi:ribosomal protein S8
VGAQKVKTKNNTEHAARKYNAEQDMKVRLLGEAVVELAKGVMLECDAIEPYTEKELISRISEVIQKQIVRMR